MALQQRAAHVTCSKQVRWRIMLCANAPELCSVQILLHDRVAQVAGRCVAPLHRPLILPASACSPSTSHSGKLRTVVSFRRSSSDMCRILLSEDALAH